MKHFAISIVVAAFAVLTISAQADTVQRAPLSQPEIDRIVQKFTENEAAFRSALTQYVFNRSANVSTLGMGGQVTGNFRRDSYMALTESGQRIEKIVFAPIPTTPPGFITPEDLEDLGGVNPFALEPSAVSNYNFTYVGKEHIDELDLYVFDVVPKFIPDPKKSKLRLFTGRIWVDDHDLMIVKTKGKAVPETKENKFPVVETWRENIDGKYWFPTFASSDDELFWDNGTSVKLRMRVKFSDYRLAHTDVKIIGEEEDVKPEAKPSPTPTPTPKKPE
jgi:hypothetical protein